MSHIANTNIYSTHSSTCSLRDFETEAKREHAIKEFQDRLVLLHHAASCPHSNQVIAEPCRAFPSCNEMVQLLKHLNQCSLKDCPLPHCVSTKYLLSHFRSCTSEDCVICKPLKDLIKKKSERSKQVITTLSKRKREDGYYTEEMISPLSTPRVSSPFELQQGEDSELSTVIPFNPFSTLQEQLFYYHQNKMMVKHGQCDCFQCLGSISKGYRYYCPSCNVNLCMKCFHYDRGDGCFPHEHPLLPKRVTRPELRSIERNSSFISLSSHTSSTQED